jgi:hypothetical protein
MSPISTLNIKNTMTNYGVGNQGLVLEQAQTWCRIKTGYWDPEP